MICKECGSDVSSSEVFCPKCGAPLRVTADYDYIQAEIGVKVDQVLNDEEEPVPEPELTIIGEKKAPSEAPAQTLRIPKPPEPDMIGDNPNPSSGENRKAERRKEPPKEKLENTISITRTLYVKDSIFADEDTPDLDDEPPVSRRQQEKSYLESRDARKQRAAERARKKRNLIILIAVIVVVVGAVVGLIISVFGKKKENAEITDIITCSVENGGSYTTPMEVTLWSDHDYRIVFTLDGSQPGVSTGTKYGQPIAFTNKDVTGDNTQIILTAYSYTNNSSIKAGELKVTFTLSKSQVTAPWMDLESGDYYEASYISINADEGCTIYYTYDGSTPSENSSKYTGPIEMKRGNYVLSAIAVDDSGVISDVSSAVYNLIIESWISYDEALSNVMDMLVSQELIESEEPDQNGYYTVPGGGTRRVINGGEAVVDNTNYYVIQVDYMNDGSSVQATTYFGVDDQTGEVIRLNRSGMSFVIG